MLRCDHEVRQGKSELGIWFLVFLSSRKLTEISVKEKKVNLVLAVKHCCLIQLVMNLLLAFTIIKTLI
ncbi:hypothetical protein L1887_28931 [Cichorium endivia]|nr:hypothetical protein L1887_28931 [Cichorium endivia]